MPRTPERHFAWRKGVRPVTCQDHGSPAARGGFEAGPGCPRRKREPPLAAGRSTKGPDEPGADPLFAAAGPTIDGSRPLRAPLLAGCERNERAKRKAQRRCSQRHGTDRDAHDDDWRPDAACGAGKKTSEVVGVEPRCRRFGAGERARSRPRPEPAQVLRSGRRGRSAQEARAEAFGRDPARGRGRAGTAKAIERAEERLFVRKREESTPRQAHERTPDRRLTTSKGWTASRV
jgi:hypothetical protein